MAKTIYPDTSKEAKDSLSEDHIREIHSKIIGALEIIGEGNFEAIAAHLNMPPEKIWKRLSEMGNDKRIYRPGHKTPTKSGRNAYVWAIGDRDNVVEVYKKGTKTAADHALNLIEHKINKSVKRDITLQWDFDNK